MKYSCDICNQTFTRAATLQRHKSSVHEGLRFECTDCKKTFSQKSDLDTHMRGVKRLRPCKFCTKVFKNHKQLKAHLTTHEDEQKHEKVDEDLHEENEKPDPEAVENYECKKCELSFASYKILQMHAVMVHQ